MTKGSTIFSERLSRQAWCRAGQQQHMQRWNMETTETHSRDKKEAGSRPEIRTQSQRQQQILQTTPTRPLSQLMLPVYPLNPKPSLLEPPTQIAGNLKHHVQDWQRSMGTGGNLMSQTKTFHHPKDRAVGRRIKHSKCLTLLTIFRARKNTTLQRI